MPVVAKKSNHGEWDAAGDEHGDGVPLTTDLRVTPAHSVVRAKTLNSCLIAQCLKGLCSGFCKYLHLWHTYPDELCRGMQVSARSTNAGREVPCKGFLLAWHAATPQGDDMVDHCAYVSFFTRGSKSPLFILLRTSEHYHSMIFINYST
ncbi:MAG: hypothetical protein ABFD58_10115, partial [Anaerolineaceae bacterium]